MAVPTPTFEDLDLSTGYTEEGTPVYIDDQHTSGSALDADGANDRLTRAAVVTTAQTTYTLQYWVKFKSTSSAYPVAQDQGSGASSKDFRTQWASSKMSLVAYGTTTGIYSSRSTSSSLTVGKWYLYTVVVDAGAASSDIIKNYLDGSPDNATISNVGGGFDETAGSNSLTIGDRGSYGSLPANAVFSRIKIWNGTALTDAQVAEEQTAECEAVVVPTWTYETDDLSTGYSESSSPTYQDDQHNPDAGVGTDGTDDNIYRTGVVASAATDFVASVWVKPTAIPPSSRPTIIGQDNGVGSQQFNIYYDSTQHFGAYAWDNSANTWTNTETSATSAIDTWYHLIMVGTASNVRLYVNGVIPSYSADNTAGPSGHFASAGVTVGRLQIGSRQSGGLFFQGETSRPRILTGATISECQAAKLYANEVAAIGEGFSTGGADNSLFTSALFANKLSSRLSSKLYTQ